MCSLPSIQAWFIQTEPSRATYLISLLNIVKCQRTKCGAGKERFQTIYPEFSSLEMPFRGFTVHFMKGRHCSLGSGHVLGWAAAHALFPHMPSIGKYFLTHDSSLTHMHNCSHSRQMHVNLCSLWSVTAQRNVWSLSWMHMQLQYPLGWSNHGPCGGPGAWCRSGEYIDTLWRGSTQFLGLF